MGNELEKVPMSAVAVRSIDESEQLKTALAVATTVETGFAIKAREDMEQAGDSARIVKLAIRAIDEGLTAAFRPLKEVERLTRNQYAPKKARLEAALRIIDGERTRWDRAEQARARAAQEAAQREANAAAEAARAAAASGKFADDEEPLAPAEVPIAAPERTVRGSLATTTATRRVRAIELVDANAAAEAWGDEVITLNVKLAKDRYDAKMKLGLLTFPGGGERGAVVGGVRFITEGGFSDRARGM